MLQHQQATQADLYPIPTVSLESPTDSYIDSYLDQVCAPLNVKLDYLEASKLRIEMRSHIESLIEANIELGATREAAIDLAIKGFGSDRSIRREWKRVIVRQQAQTDKYRVRICLAAALSTYFVAPFWAALFGSNRNVLDSYMHFINSSSTITLIMTYLPVYAGLLAGIIVGRRSVPAMWSALIRFIPAIALFNTIWIMIVQAGMPSGDGVRDWAYDFSLQALAFSCSWIPLACICAGVAGFLRQQINRAGTFTIAR